MEQNSSIGGGVGWGARVALAVPAVPGPAGAPVARAAAALGPPGLGCAAPAGSAPD